MLDTFALKENVSSHGDRDIKRNAEPEHRIPSRDILFFFSCSACLSNAGEQSSITRTGDKTAGKEGCMLQDKTSMNERHRQEERIIRCMSQHEEQERGLAGTEVK